MPPGCSRCYVRRFNSHLARNATATAIDAYAAYRVPLSDGVAGTIQTTSTMINSASTMRGQSGRRAGAFFGGAAGIAVGVPQR
jgi:hypothetical protein